MTTSIVHIEDHKAFVEKQRQLAITRRKMILVLRDIDPWDFPKDWCDDLKAEDWFPPTPEEIQERAARPNKPVDVPENPRPA